MSNESAGAVNELCFATATQLAARLRAGELSSVEVMDAHLRQIEQLNPRVNAIVTFLPEAARRAAEQADASRARGAVAGPLHGLPVAVKDTVMTRGVRTTYGSPIFRDFVPEDDALLVERLKRAGAIIVGKTNTPEFAAGSQTYNEVFGETLNPYDLRQTCGGSSGGAAVALACGMVPLAQGSDMGGSLRNPASFCNVVGFRPSPGRVPTWPKSAAWLPLDVEGPMARTVEDAALLLSALAGPDPRSPIALSEPGERFAADLERDFRGLRVAFSQDLGGLPVDPRVRAVVEGARDVLRSMGCQVRDGEPDFRGADQAFKVWRAWAMELAWGHLLQDHRQEMKDTVVWNIEQGQRLTGPEIAAAERERSALYQRVRLFLEDFDFLVLPVSQVPPFDVRQRYVERIEDVAMETYIDWMKSCYFVSVIGLPAISIPCGFTSDGLPVGVQIVGRHQDDFGVLQLAYAYQEATGVWRRPPPLTGIRAAFEPTR